MSSGPRASAGLMPLASRRETHKWAATIRRLGPEWRRSTTARGMGRCPATRRRAGSTCVRSAARGGRRTSRSRSRRSPPPPRNLRDAFSPNVLTRPANPRGPMPKPDSSKVPPRAEHPYHMHDAIMAQPAALEAVLSGPGEGFERAAEAVTEADRVYLTGMGTSLHAATVGRFLLEHALGAEADLRVASAFELAARGKFSKSDAVIVVSHRGWKRYVSRVVELAMAGQATTVAVTGKEGG